jgi:hypothetical protein
MGGRGMSETEDLLREALNALILAREEISDWGAYASTYFQEKYALDENIKANDDLINRITEHLYLEQRDE